MADRREADERLTVWCQKLPWICSVKKDSIAEIFSFKYINILIRKKSIETYSRKKEKAKGDAVYLEQFVIIYQIWSGIKETYYKWFFF